jgi:hypothetical protein
VKTEFTGRYYYCTKCGERTLHREVRDDEHDGLAIECMVCHLVWVTGDDLTEEDFNA